METLIGVACKDFVLIAADMTNVNSLFVMKNGNSLFLKVLLFRARIGFCHNLQIHFFASRKFFDIFTTSIVNNIPWKNIFVSCITTQTT